MKQLKFLMIVFTLMMGVSFTSCMGESDPTVSPVATLKVVSAYPYTFQYPNDGLKIVASNTSELLTDNSVNLGLGDIIFLQYTYNSEEQPLTSETKEITAKVTIGHNCISGNTSIGVPVENNGAGELYENATIVELLPAGQGTMYYDKNTLLLGVTFYGEKSPYKHEFSLIYGDDNHSAGDAGKDEEGIMKLYLRHVNNEEKPTERFSMYRAFDLSQFLAAFGETPTKIRIYANETDKNGSYSLEDAKKELQYEEIDYKSIFEKN